jgi:ABC-2 type transport system ATP-binding protein
VRRHCPERSVILTTEDERGASYLHRVPNVTSVVRHGPRYTIEGQREDLVADVIQCLSEHQIRVTDFRTKMPTLEDVFLKLTGHSIRD